MKKLLFILGLIASFSTNAEWVNLRTDKSPMDDSISQQWKNLSTDRTAELLINNQTYKKNTNVFLMLRSKTTRWLPFKTNTSVLDGKIYHQGI